MEKINAPKIIIGDCVESMKTLPDQSVDCCITSPPYWGLRDYGTEDQLGLEETPEQYVQNMVRVFSEVKRVLKDDGTLWLNLGDSYFSTQNSNRNGLSGSIGGKIRGGGEYRTQKRKSDTLKKKDLVGIPWKVAFALQADGWYLRQDIIWHKPNPMPESVTDRCTKSHEYIFLLSKSEKYYYDHEAIKENSKQDWGTRDRTNGKYHKEGTGLNAHTGLEKSYEKANKRSVWSVPTRPYSDAHFATFPEELIEPCILAGCPKYGVVLDPFGGSGTTGKVALKHNRNSILCEINPEYVKLMHKRIKSQTLSLPL